MTRNAMQDMLRDIHREYAYTAMATGLKKPAPRVVEAMARVCRDAFVPEAMKAYAYDNNALPIGLGQTISQPFIVALMTDLLNTKTTDIILEVGTGSGYQAAVLSLLVRKVYSIEILPELAEKTSRLLRSLGYDNIDVLCANGYHGLPAQAPFDGILVTAAAPHIPPALKKQLKPGGHLVIPVGLPYCHQELMVLDKGCDDTTSTRDILGVAFVPLTGVEEISRE